MKPEINASNLYAVSHANPTSEAVYKALKARRRNANYTDLRQFRKASLSQNINQQHFFDFFKHLQDENVGSLILRKGKPPRFKWDFSLREVVKMVDKAPKMAAVAMSKEKTTRPDATVSSTHKPEYSPIKGITTTLEFERASGGVIRISLPTDLTQEEAQAIAQVVKGLGR